MARLPEDPAYWEKLTDQIVANAAGRLNAYRGVGKGWLHAIARLSMPLTAGAAAAVIAALVWRPHIVREPPQASPATVYGFAPADPLAAPFVMSAAPPTMATLMALPTSESAQ